MSKPFKTNEVPVAPFNLRTEGPMTLLAASAAVHGKNFRAALQSLQTTSTVTTPLRFRRYI